MIRFARLLTVTIASLCRVELVEILSVHRNIVKPVLSGHSKLNKIKVFMTNGSLMKVESIAECSVGAFCNTFDLH